MQRILFFTTALLTFNLTKAQKDTVSSKIGTMDEIVITSTRTEIKLSNAAVPTQIVSKKYINQTGSLKLQDILQEQTGITVVNSILATSLSGYPNPFGQGVQMLGLDPAYTSILMDGEPLIGRNAGILKLGRIATGNIRQVEIVKGPSSSLYGSEALAGVINIITDAPKSESMNFQLHAATNNTYAQTLSYSNRINKTGIQLFANHYSTQGYDLNKNIYGNTIDPYRDWSMNLKLTQTLTSKSQLLLSFRNYDSKQKNNYQINWQSEPSIVKGFTKETDNSIFAQLTYLASPRNKFIFRTFADRYSNKSYVNLEKNNLRFDETSFDQSIIKPEIQYEINGSNQRYIIGGGTYFESIDASRYAGRQNLFTGYFFTQNEWYLLDKKLTLIAGARLDKRTDFNLNVSPRFAAAYKPTPHWKITGSAGWGFKAPDFRHMYLSFNNAQIGYSLIGNNVLSEELQILQLQGLLEQGSDITPYNNISRLLPEKSFGTHLGLNYHKNSINIELGLFRNDINNLIDVYLLPIRKTNFRSIYSYHNVNKIFTQGAEIDIKYSIIKNISISAGYQYLEAKDKEILSNIQSGKIYKRDPVTYVTSLVTKAQYFGLPNRSRHSFNFKLAWNDDKRKINAFLRVMYRGKFGFSDVNGNAIIDDDREMVKGYWMLNVAASKSIGKRLNVQAGVENLLNYRNPLQLPNIAGRLYFLNLNYSINHLFNKI